MPTDISDLPVPKFRKQNDNYMMRGSNERDYNEIPQKLAEVQSLLSRLKGRKDEGVPTQPGICIPEGVITDTNEISRDNISMVYKNNDFVLAVNTKNPYRKNKTLLERGGEINTTIIRIGARTLRKGTVTLPEINAEEWLVKSKQDIYHPQEKIVPAYRFTFYGNEDIADARHPVFSIELNNSDLETKTYTGSQLVDIWDRITRTFRYRSGAFSGHTGQ